MKVLGPALITGVQQRAMSEGTVLTVPAGAVYADAAPRASVGAWWWAKEPYQEYVAKKSGVLLGLVRGIGPLAARSKELTDKLRTRAVGGQTVYEYRCCQYTGEHLSRADSWTSLEIIEVLPDAAGWQCRAHMKNIDALVAERRAA